MFSGARAFTVAFASSKSTTYVASRSIKNQTWKGKPAYKSGSPEQQKCIDTAFKGAKDLGFDDKGAVDGEIAGGFHNHTPGGTGPQWITVQYKDGNGKTLYHKKADGSEWDRIHLYDDLTHNEDPSEKPVAIFTKDEI